MASMPIEEPRAKINLFFISNRKQRGGKNKKKKKTKF
jgi:hypothetical protein